MEYKGRQRSLLPHTAENRPGLPASSSHGNHFPSVFSENIYFIQYYFTKYIIGDTERQEAIKDFSSCFTDLTVRAKGIKAKKLVVFLHGWGADSSCYHGFCEGLLNKYNADLVLSSDFLGFGKSPELTRVFSMRDYVIVLKRLLFLFDVEEIYLVGHSFGGKTILFLLSDDNFIASYNDKIKQVVCVSPSGVKPRFNLCKYLKIKKYKHVAKKCKNNDMYGKKLLNYGSSDYKNISSENLRKTFVVVVNTHLSKTVYGLAGRIVFVFSNKDRETPMYMGKKLTKLFNGSILKKVNGDHYTIMFKPEVILDII